MLLDDKVFQRAILEMLSAMTSLTDFSATTSLTLNN